MNIHILRLPDAAGRSPDSIRGSGGGDSGPVTVGTIFCTCDGLLHSWTLSYFSIGIPAGGGPAPATVAVANKAQSAVSEHHTRSRNGVREIWMSRKAVLTANRKQLRWPAAGVSSSHKMGRIGNVNSKNEDGCSMTTTNAQKSSAAQAVSRRLRACNKQHSIKIICP